jgi:HD-GYP domain-containing protein (c-di-GMP phosphodiesterase class II)
MRRALPVAAVALLLSPSLALAFFVIVPERDPLAMEFGLHFWSVSGTALAAAIASVVVIVSAPSLRETRLLFLALAFVAIAGVFSVHGLMTPGHIVDDLHATIPLSAWLSVFLGAVFAALSVYDFPEDVDRWIARRGPMIFAWVTIAVGGYVAISLASPAWLDGVPTENRAAQYVIAFASFALYALAAHRYYQAYLFARLPSQAAMVAAQLLLTQVPLIILWGFVWHISWWMYHAMYAVAFVVLFAGWAIEVRRAGSLKVIADALSMRDALAQLNRGHDEHVLELVDAIEAKDRATLGHVRRVSAYALDIGKQLGLAPTELRSLALAAEMHDVGKIGVPDAILGKPAKLNDDEYAEMRRHAVRGYDIATRVPALRPVAPVIRAHHERVAGQGYPDGLTGEAIPLLARIIAVADTYDAMTSTRPYRPAMPQVEAVAELLRVRGTELDPVCVDAFLETLETSRSAAA